MTQKPVSDFNADRLANVLERLSSPHDGEALNAARAAARLVLDAGLAWRDIISGPTSAPPAKLQAVVDPRGEGPTLTPPVGTLWVDTLRQLCAVRAGRNPRENRFLDQVCVQQTSPVTCPRITYGQAAEIMTIYRAWAGISETV